MSTKEDRENFVSDHSGSSPFAILTVLIASATLTILSLCFTSECKTQLLSFHPLALVFVEFFLLAVLQVSLVTTQDSFEIGSKVLITLAFCFYKFYNKPTRTVDSKVTSSLLTTYRTTIYMLTIISILAVDFPLFPRAFCKTEEYGYGLMDLGTASFVLMSSLTSGYARKLSQKSFLKVAQTSLPLFVIGLVRLATTKGVDYQEHVSEYVGKRASCENENEERSDEYYCYASSLCSSHFAQRAAIVLAANSLHFNNSSNPKSGTTTAAARSSS